MIDRLVAVGSIALALCLGPIPAAAQTSGAAASRSISFAKIRASIPAGTPWAKLQFDDPPFPCRPGRTLTWDAESNESFQDRDFERVFREALAQAGLKVSGDPNNLFEEDQKSGELQVGALLTRIDATFCSKRSLKDQILDIQSVSVAGSISIDVEWQVYSALEGKVVARIKTTGQYGTKSGREGGASAVIQQGFADAAQKFAADPQLGALTSIPPPTGATTGHQPIRFSPSREARVALGDARSSVATVFAGEAIGSAFLVSAEGYVLTNRHVVGDAPRVRLRWSDGTESVGAVMRSDRRRDVALIKVDPGSRRPLPLRSGQAQLGEAVFAIGTPLDSTLQGSVTKGIVSATRTYEGLPYIQSDVTVNPGNSGGPLLDEKGSILGITVLRFGPDGIPTGINLFIPIDEALKALALTPTS